MIVALLCERDRFNPRPVARPGEPRRKRVFVVGCLGVSIHARSLDRANRSRHRADRRPSAVSIHARSLDRANPPIQGFFRIPPLFQSTPGRSTGRTKRAGVDPPAGDPVSIHARSLDRANRFAGGISASHSRVSIHARSLDRANLLRRDARSIRPRFQSTPGRSTGRTPRRSSATPTRAKFQSTPGRSTGRT